MQDIAVIDYGMGNVRSVANALAVVAPNAQIAVTADPEWILAASHIVFPGQGAIAACIKALNQLGLIDIIQQVAVAKPFLGICIGMQLLLTHSDENDGIAGLDLLAGNVHHFAKEQAVTDHKLKIPHMGWNKVHQTVQHPLWQNIEQDSHFYFVHSYYALPENNNVIAATSRYPNDFSCALYQDNIFATQFHPEKSQHAGLQLLENFVNWNGTL